MIRIITSSLLMIGVQGVEIPNLDLRLKPKEIENVKSYNLDGLHVIPDFELDIFGISYHTNREADYNEKNYGVGITVVGRRDIVDRGWDISIQGSTGIYYDSFRDPAIFGVIGPRLTLGYRDSFNVGLCLAVGYMNGSGNRGITWIPYMTIGYDWFNVGLTGDPIERKIGDDPTKVLGIFFKFKL